MSFYLHDKSWKTIENDLKSSDTVIVPLGALEAHGPHNPVGCCFMLAEVASREVGRRTGISVTPTIPFGVSHAYKNFPGTITVNSEALMGYVSEVCLSLVRSGFRKIAFFSAHGGNNLSVLRELSSELREQHGVLCTVLHLWGLIKPLTPPEMMEPNLKLGHGGDPTTSVMLHIFPDLVDLSKANWKPLRQPLKGFKTTSYGTHTFKEIPLNIVLRAEEVAESGLMGDPSKALRDKGEKLYNSLIDYIVTFIEAFEKLDPSLNVTS
jgi:creatinine amidohydrolase